MWIRTQLGLTLVNADKIITITAKSNHILAHLDGSNIDLGEYADASMSKRLLGIILILLGNELVHQVDMPTKEEVTEEWLTKCEEVMKR